MPDDKKTVAFFPAHPSQLWMLRTLEQEVSAFANVIWVLRDKDCTVSLAQSMGLPFIPVSQAATGLVRNGIEFGANILRCWQISQRYNIDLWLTKYGAASMVARSMGRRSLSFNDDDADIVPLMAWTSYPFCDLALVTESTRMGRFANKAVRYASFNELLYLHPTRFRPDDTVRSELGLSNGERYAIVRLSALQAHHDNGIRGVSEDLLRRVVKLTDGRLHLFIVSEKPLASEFEPLRCPISPARIMHALAYADFFLGDSQTMTSEAALLGTPAFRINDFVGRISYLNKLEHLGLAFGFKPGHEAALLRRLGEYLELADGKSAFARLRDSALEALIDPLPWYVHVIQMVLHGASPQDVRRWAYDTHGLC